MTLLLPDRLARLDSIPLQRGSHNENDALRMCACGCGAVAPLASRTSTKTSAIRGRSQRFISGHNSRLRLPRVSAAVEDRGYDTPCLVWLRPLSAKGYGHVQCRGVKTGAHRYVYEAVHGPIADGLQLDHLCRQRDCVNPAHLEPVTSAENARRSHAIRASDLLDRMIRVEAS